MSGSGCCRWKQRTPWWACPSGSKGACRERERGAAADAVVLTEVETTMAGLEEEQSERGGEEAKALPPTSPHPTPRLLSVLQAPAPGDDVDAPSGRPRQRTAPTH